MLDFVKTFVDGEGFVLSLDGFALTNLEKTNQSNCSSGGTIIEKNSIHHIEKSVNFTSVSRYPSRFPRMDLQTNQIFQTDQRIKYCHTSFKLFFIQK